MDQQWQMAERLSAITQKIGFTLWQVQELESVSAQYFVLLTQARKGMGLAEGNELVEKAQRGTFGSTIRQITKAGLLSPDLETRFITILAERNWLVHRSRASSRDAIHRDSSMQKLINRLDVLAEESLTLLKEIGTLIDSFVKQHGVPDKYIDIKTKELLEQWHGSDTL